MVDKQISKPLLRQRPIERYSSEVMCYFGASSCLFLGNMIAISAIACSFQFPLVYTMVAEELDDKGRLSRYESAVSAGYRKGVILTRFQWHVWKEFPFTDVVYPVHNVCGVVWCGVHQRQHAQLFLPSSADQENNFVCVRQTVWTANDIRVVLIKILYLGNRMI